MCLGCYGSKLSVLINYYYVLIDYMFWFKAFLAFCSVVIDYDFVLINDMLWFMASFGFVFYFHDESTMIQMCFDDNNDDNKR